MSKTLTGYIKWITEDEFNLLIGSLKDYELNWKLILHIMFYMGLRRGEVCRLKWSNIIGDFEYLRYSDVKTGKIHQRVIPYKVKKLFEIYSFVFRYFVTNNYIFEPNRHTGSKNDHILPNSITAKFQRLRNKTGLKDWYYERSGGKKLYRISPHTFRHYFLTKLYKVSGNDLITTQRIIGHSRPEITAQYIFNIADEEKKLVNMI